MKATTRPEFLQRRLFSALSADYYIFNLPRVRGGRGAKWIISSGLSAPIAGVDRAVAEMAGGIVLQFRSSKRRRKRRTSSSEPDLTLIATLAGQERGEFDVLPRELHRRHQWG
jgi:hypothetical protein